MLAQLNIRDIVLIDRLDLQFGTGLTVLTGETGAGKSILLDSLALALGGRGDGSMVRQGEKQGQVTAVFDLALDHPAWDVVRAQDLEPDGTLILRRVQMPDGRTRAFLNDAPISAQTLREVSRRLVEIHGQHDDRALVDPAAHRTLLDAYGGLERRLEAVRGTYAARKAAERLHEDEQARIAKARADADYLHHVHEELAKLNPKGGEEEALSERRALMQQSEKVSGDLRDAYESVGGEGSPTSTFSALLRRLERRAGQAPDLIEPCLKALDSVLVALDGATAALDEALQAADFDPRELEAVEERLFALRAAARKHSVGVEALPELLERFTRDIEALDAGETRLAALAKAVDAARDAYRKAAEDLSKARQAASSKLDVAVNRELGPLKLERARFSTQIESDPATAGPDGIDRVEFWVSTNPGTRPGPLTKVASGGELARFMLALKVSLADRGSAPTLVFDEIDTGVGGAVADAIGSRLARLSGKIQVLAVTHAPQVAARSASHLRISKSALKGEGRVATRVTTLVDDSRREEIARMLAGATITEEARAAARRLIETAT
ncbi:DNA repair protein RecN [Lichenibacterium ramalinae]|uniref:DNA repair protein RecN n=1 Tax=Lichenibacterium ramalinae TaxID=2316527 RepID=A0A4Q2RB42_9HYPH|nr:DNA repair protein RecN [Lichenibacterium ramalinae]RYB02886.1 DNA repair protein RecN [Lichenibacterium ramalinae]